MEEIINRMDKDLRTGYETPIVVRDNRPDTRCPELIENGSYERFTGQGPRQSAKYERSGADRKRAV
jgi:hypothetical protein